MDHHTLQIGASGRSHQTLSPSEVNRLSLVIPHVRSVIASLRAPVTYGWHLALTEATVDGRRSTAVKVIIPRLHQSLQLGSPSRRAGPAQN